MFVKINPSWKKHLNDEFEKPYFKKLIEFVKDEYSKHRVYPNGKEIFSAFDKCCFEDTRIVILGQDPYHGPNQANGLCFSVKKGIPLPPSLQNIFKEIKDDLGIDIPNHGDLEHWAKQGILLLNSILTVRDGMPGSHQNKGWEIFTDAVIKIINEKKRDVVFMLWGAYAQKKAHFIDREKHFVLSSTHPSPLSAHRGFLGCKHFSNANNYLKSKNTKCINW
ncbi:uracil-DNA glycosylase [Ichthyobacterium seriolicida]|uniref:Uracil-DNA glycosylase n=1 Tax=Ichthyobacterium seriolicida TaxID=242600 RepID=A0A1J1E546_9FLAO|nr:uracil-DNA glycosylase [Ichthyobacterium seriolicida]BAV95180.1 uracil-DNA glycosylase, family 1 [Ichthyobacterium seriolicida]